MKIDYVTVLGGWYHGIYIDGVRVAEGMEISPFDVMKILTSHFVETSAGDTSLTTTVVDEDWLLHRFISAADEHRLHKLPILFQDVKAANVEAIDTRAK